MYMTYNFNCRSEAAGLLKVILYVCWKGK